MFSFVKRLIKRKKSKHSIKAPTRDLTDSEWRALVKQEKKRVETEIKAKRNVKKSTATKTTTPSTQRKPTTTAKNKTPDYVKQDAEIVGKYIIPKGRGKTKEFAADMGISTHELGKILGEDNKYAPKRVVIPKTILSNGLKYVKYASYDGDLSSAQEAANDLRELGYKTKIEKFQKKSYSTYVLYRYKNTRSFKEPAKQPIKRVNKRRIKR